MWIFREMGDPWKVIQRWGFFEFESADKEQSARLRMRNRVFQDFQDSRKEFSSA